MVCDGSVGAGCRCSGKEAVWRGACRLQWVGGGRAAPGPGWGQAWSQTDRQTGERRAGGSRRRLGCRGEGPRCETPPPPGPGLGPGGGRAGGPGPGAGRCRGLLAGNPGPRAHPRLKAQAPRAPALKGVGSPRPWEGAPLAPPPEQSPWKTADRGREDRLKDRLTQVDRKQRENGTWPCKLETLRESRGRGQRGGSSQRHRQVHRQAGVVPNAAGGEGMHWGGGVLVGPAPTQPEYSLHLLEPPRPSSLYPRPPPTSSTSLGTGASSMPLPSSTQ